MKLAERSSVIKMAEFDEETLTPEAFLKLTDSQKKDVVRASPVVQGFGQTPLGSTGFVKIHVKWKMPKYRVKL